MRVYRLAACLILVKGFMTSQSVEIEALAKLFVSFGLDSELNVLFDPVHMAQMDRVLQLYHSLSSREISAFDLSQMAPLSPGECPLYDTINVNIRKNDKAQKVLPVFKRFRSIFIWTSDPTHLDLAYSLLNSTAVDCNEEVDLGLLDYNNRLYFYVDSEDALIEEVFQRRTLQSHPHVAVLKRLEAERDGGVSLAAFHNAVLKVWPLGVAPRLSLVWSSHDDTGIRGDAFFAQLTDFKNKRLKVSVMVWADWVIGDPLNSTDPSQMYTNYSGIELEMLSALGERLHFDVDVYNPPDGQWLLFDADGNWLGLMAEVAHRRADVAVACLNLAHSFAQVIQYSVPYFSDFRAIASPLPRARPRSLAVVLPLDVASWALVVAAFPLTSLLVLAVANIESRIVGQSFAPWDQSGQIFKIIFSHFTSQCHADTMKTATGLALRICLTSWLYFVLVVTSSYGGMLRGILTSPRLYPAVSDLDGVLASHLRWRIYDYGLQNDANFFLNSGDQVLKTIWTDKLPDEYADDMHLGSVVSGDLITIDYWSALSELTRVRYSTASGTPLLHLEDTPTASALNPVTMFYRPDVPWRDVFDQYIYRMLSGGLLTKWSSMSVQRLKQERLSSPESETRTGAGAKATKSEASAMSLNDLQSAFILWGFGSVCALLVFAPEVISRLRLKKLANKLHLI